MFLIEISLESKLWTKLNIFMLWNIIKKNSFSMFLMFNLTFLLDTKNWTISGFPHSIAQCKGVKLKMIN